MPTFKAPGVYVDSRNNVPTAISPVETAIPAFVGYTERADRNGKSLLNRPYRIGSMEEYEEHFGLHAVEQFDWTDANDPHAFNVTYGKHQYYLKPVGAIFQLYKSIKLFFQNGGSNCYIVSVDNYQQGLDASKFIRGLDVLRTELAPTLLLVPDAISLPQLACFEVQNSMIAHCAKLRNRIAIIDVFERATASPAIQQQQAFKQDVAKFRVKVGNTSDNSYAAAYTPYLHTVAIPDSECNLSRFSSDARAKLSNVLMTDSDAANLALRDVIASISAPQKPQLSDHDIHRFLLASSGGYQALIAAIKKFVNVVGPSGAVAGAICMVDTVNGVWKAPANVCLSGVKSPTLAIDTPCQEHLNTDASGKSINAIRTFPGKGVLIWGARTLDSMRYDGRYISSRRTLIMIEQSLRSGIKAFVFEPNNENTWTIIDAIANDFLMRLWKNGALCGATPREAFAVLIGVNTTMSQADVTRGNLILQVAVALTRPAEFAMLRITQKMQS